MKIDLHVHTDMSDGFLNIKQTLQRAKDIGLDALAITDHDTTDGILPAIILGQQLGIRVIPGIEISAIDSKSGTKAHILGYFMNFPANHVERLCAPIRKARHEHSIWQMQQLLEHKYNIDIDAVVKGRKGRVVYKQHIMKHLIEIGYTDHIYSDLYFKLFKNGGICSREIEYINAIDAIKSIKADGGIAVLAHPGYDKNYFLVDKLVAAGLDGIELFHEKHSLNDLKKIIRLAKKHNLILSGGSDYHGDVNNNFFGRLVCPQKTLSCFVQSSKNDLAIFLHELLSKGSKYFATLCADNPLRLEFKDQCPNDLVTNVDIKLEEFLVQEIQSVFPNSSFITEEKTISNATQNEYTWIIDPVDGTTNFVNCARDYAISIAVYKNGAAYTGIIYDLVTQDCYFALCGHGAWLNGQQLQRKNSGQILKNAVVDFSLNTMIQLRTRGQILERLAKDIRGHRSYGCASLSICRIATGKLDAYISSKLCIWDYAAASIFLQEMGGDILTQLKTQQCEKCELFLAASSTQLLQEILQKIE